MRLSALLLAGALLLPIAAWADPLHVVSFKWTDNRIPNSQVLNVIQGQLQVRNTSSHSVSDVTLAVHLRNRNGHDVDVEKQVVGTLRPGEQSTFNWHWRDYNNITVSPLANVQHASGVRMVSFVAHPTGGPALAPAETGAAPAYTQNNTGPTLHSYKNVPNAQATAPGSGVSGQTPSP